jgi:YidC/Oxa1 family membrane protein insertase
MERNTILAVVLSTIVLVAAFIIQGIYFPPPVPQSAAQPEGQQSAVQQSEAQQETQAASQQAAPEVPQLVSPVPSGSEEAQPTAPQYTAPDTAGPQVVEYVTVDTQLMTVVLTSMGGDIVSWKLKDHFDKDDKVDMIFSGTNEARAFSVAFGDAQPLTAFFHVTRLTAYSVEFHRDFLIPGTTDGWFRLTKRYDFKPDEYMFEMTVTLDGGHAIPGFNFGGSAYTLSFGPQIGPKFVKLENYYDDYRQYVAFINGKRKNVKVNEIIDSRPSWAAITGKYFVFIAIPYLPQFSISFSETPEPGIPSASRFSLVRPATTSSRTSDIFRFYLGPKSQDALAIYDTGQNEYGLKDTKIIEIASTRGILAPLEKLLKWLLQGFYKIIPNWGVAIILLTLLVKILFFPLTKKGSEATLRMQALAPKIKELQEKYKDNRQKLNAEMAQFYQKEGYNPISGCLPMLLQIPIFFAMYSLFNSHFDLRGAGFIPGWIDDLSVPEAVVNFPEGFRLPLLGWTALRALPFLYVFSQLLYGKVTQMPGQQSNTQMKMMLYVLPIVFFFVLYNVPSGLLIYWIFSNLLTLVQQVLINRFVLAKRAQAEQEAAAQKPVIAPPPPPPGKKKRRKKT